MTWHAIEDIEDAFAATKAFCWPIDRPRWLRLAVITFFVGGGISGANPAQFSGSTTPPGDPSMPADMALPGGPELAIIGAIIAIIILLAIGFLLVGSIMEFVFVESLRKEAIAIRRYWGTYWKRGLRLAGFRIALGLLALIFFGSIVAAFVAPWLIGLGAGLSIVILLALVPFMLLLGIGIAIVNAFTTMFVVPIMLKEDRGVIDAWKRFWPTLRSAWKQFGLYLVMSFVLQLAAGIVFGIALAVAVIVLAIPLGIIGVIGALTEGTAGLILIGIAVGLLITLGFIVAIILQVPIKTYLRYYGLFVLGDIEEAFDVVETRRELVREAPTVEE